TKVPVHSYPNVVDPYRKIGHSVGPTGDSALLTNSFTRALILTAVGLTSVWGVTLDPAQPGANISYIPSVTYCPGCKVSLDPLSVQLLTRGGSTALVDAMGAQFPGYSLSAPINPLPGTFRIDRYEAIADNGAVGA